MREGLSGEVPIILLLLKYKDVYNYQYEVERDLEKGEASKW
jgi:hypothetical protein